MTCKFCGFEWSFDNPCDTSTYITDEDGGGYLDEPTCGNQECPMCLSCQGCPVNEHRVENSKRIRELREKHGFKLWRGGVVILDVPPKGDKQ